MTLLLSAEPAGLLSTEWVNFAYIVASAIFILGIKMLGKVETARKGNFLSAVGMAIAIIATVVDKDVFAASGISHLWLLLAIIIGSLIGVILAQKVKMTAMPEMVALLNGFGGLASFLVAWGEYDNARSYASMADYLQVHAAFNAHFFAASTAAAIVIGAVTFTGSMLAFAKLAEWVSGRPFLFKGQHLLNALLLILALLALVYFTLWPEGSCALAAFYLFTALSLVLGVSIILPIGGGDMPTVISMLNSLSGMAACAAGFILMNNVLIVAGTLVGASGIVLTVIMAKAMNRTVGNILFSGFGAQGGAASAQSGGELKPISLEDAYYVLEAARSVAVIPGYGMAVAQAQHAVKELANILEKNGTEVRFAIHPVAGRMPGHMNVLLAEADVPYDQLWEMDKINPTMPQVDVALVIGANDVVNPAAAQDPASPIYGMPIIKAHEAKTVIVLKRGKGTGFSGLENQLFILPQTRMLYGDAKSTLTQLVAQFK